MSFALTDKYGRPLRDLRISVTDRCNFRCGYCMPKEVYGSDYPFLARSEILTFEEIERLARIFVTCGVQKLRVTGGEPLLRREIAALVEMLASLPGVLDIALTTNGALLATKAAALKAAGLRRITVSLDSIDPAVFGAMNGVGYPVARILSGIEAARRAGLDPLKINVVVRRGINDGTVVQTARYFHGSGCIVRFIEYMDVGSTNGWTMDQVVSGADIVKQLDAAMPLEAISPTYRGEVARRYRYRDGGGEIGIVTSVTQPFCRDCTRARLSSAGVLYTCLFATRGLDLGKMLRSQCSDDEIAFAIRTAWTGRQDRYSELRTASSSAEAKVEMSHIGG